LSCQKSIGGTMWFAQSELEKFRPNFSKIYMHAIYNLDESLLKKLIINIGLKIIAPYNVAIIVRTA
jgi:hypothetical protein